jgi:peptidoglycan hydrolase-like protein with peptidoglycan-binding domain
MAGDAVRRLQRALRRTPILGLVVDGVFGPTTEAAVRDFQQGASLAVDGVVGALSWSALPDGRPMPTLEEGSIGAVVRSLQEVLLNGASGQWYTAPGALRHKDIYDRMVADYATWNATMLPFDPQSSTDGFNARQLAVHFGVEPPASKPQN